MKNLGIFTMSADENLSIENIEDVNNLLLYNGMAVVATTKEVVATTKEAVVTTKEAVGKITVKQMKNNSYIKKTYEVKIR